jgi:putative sterol carrier protein
MSELMEKARAAMEEKFGGGFAAGTAKFVISDEGALMLDAQGVRIADEPADVTLTADSDTFQAILAGETNPTAAFMTGKLTVDGDMGLAMQLGNTLV